MVKKVPYTNELIQPEKWKLFLNKKNWLPVRLEKPTARVQY